MKLPRFPIKKFWEREKKEEGLEEDMYKLLQEKEIILNALESNGKKFPEFEKLHEIILYKEKQWNLRQLLKNIDKLKNLNVRMEKMEDEFLRFEEKDIEAVKHFDVLLVDDEDELRELIRFHDRSIKLDKKHRGILQHINFKDGINKNEERALVNLLYVMKYVHNDVLKLKTIIKSELKTLEEHSETFEKLKEASEGKIKEIDDKLRHDIDFAVKEFMMEIDEEVSLVRKLRGHFEIEEGRLGIVRNLESERLEKQLEAA